jgi:hypothetical protein
MFTSFNVNSTTLDPAQPAAEGRFHPPNDDAQAAGAAA